MLRLLRSSIIGNGISKNFNSKSTKSFLKNQDRNPQHEFENQNKQSSSNNSKKEISKIFFKKDEKTNVDLKTKNFVGSKILISIFGKMEQKQRQFVSNYINFKNQSSLSSYSYSYYYSNFFNNNNNHLFFSRLFSTEKTDELLKNQTTTKDSSIESQKNKGQSSTKRKNKKNNENKTSTTINSTITPTTTTTTTTNANSISTSTITPTTTTTTPKSNTNNKNSTMIKKDPMIGTGGKNRSADEFTLKLRNLLWQSERLSKDELIKRTTQVLNEMGEGRYSAASLKLLIQLYTEAGDDYMASKMYSYFRYHGYLEDPTIYACLMKVYNN